MSDPSLSDIDFTKKAWVWSILKFTGDAEKVGLTKNIKRSIINNFRWPIYKRA